MSARSLDRRRRAILWGAAMLALGGGCAAGPAYRRPAVVAPARWQVEEPWREADPKDAIPRTAWWTLFGDGELSGLEADLLAANPTLQTSVARLAQARASAAVQNANLFPVVSTAPSAGRQRYSGARPTGTAAPLPGPVTQSDYLLPFSVSYEADLFGKRRRSIEAAQASYQASAADLESVRLTLTAELAADYFTLRQLDSQIGILDRTVQDLQKGLELVTSRHAGGLASGLDVAQEETLLQITRTQATLLHVQRKQFEDAIAVLAGKAAPDFHLAPRDLAAEPPRIDTALPSDVLERRPDIAEAERLMAVANAEVGVAKAAYYPSLLLFGQAGWNSSVVSRLVSAASSFWAVAANVTESLFTGGARGAQVDAALAGYQGAVASYRGAVLNAFREVQDDIAGLQILEAAHQSQAEAVASSHHQLDLATYRYVGGVANYLDVVSAQQNLLANQQQAAVIQGQRLITSVLLVKALGGGWDAASLSAIHLDARWTDAFTP